MTIPTSEPLPDDNFDNLPPARRRRGRRLIVPPSAGERARLLDELALRAMPSFDFYLFSLLSGAVIGLGFLLDSPGLLILAALLAPFMAPIIGLSLSAIVGAGRYFLQVLVGTVIGSLLVFGGGALAGLAAPIWLTNTFPQAIYHTRFSIPDLLVVALGVILTTITMVRSEEKPVLTSVALAYELYLPLSAAGFGLTSKAPDLFTNGLNVFAVHLTLALLLGVITLAVLKFRPLTLFGYTWTTTIVLVAIILGVGVTGLRSILNNSFGPTTPAMAALPTRAAVTPPTAARTLTPTLDATTAPLQNLTPTHTLIPSQTPTVTITPAPTPVWAQIYASNDSGALIRSKPNGDILTSVMNGALVQVLGDTVKEDYRIWIKVRTTTGKEGWILQSLLVTATPSAGW